MDFLLQVLLLLHILNQNIFMLGTTFGGNHLACAAALAVLEVIEEEKLMDNASNGWKIFKR